MNQTAILSFYTKEWLQYHSQGSLLLVGQVRGNGMGAQELSSLHFTNCFLCTIFGTDRVFASSLLTGELPRVISLLNSGSNEQKVSMLKVLKGLCANSKLRVGSKSYICSFGFVIIRSYRSYCNEGGIPNQLQLGIQSPWQRLHGSNFE